MNEITPKKFMSPIEVAKHFSVTRQTVYNWIDASYIQSVKVGARTVRIPIEEVERISSLLKENEQELQKPVAEIEATPQTTPQKPIHNSPFRINI